MIMPSQDVIFEPLYMKVHHGIWSEDKWWKYYAVWGCFNID